MVCLDTDIIVAAFHGDEEAKKTIAEFDQASLKTTVITACELHRGASKLGGNRPNQTKSFLSTVEILCLDQNGAEIFGRLCTELSSRGETTPDFDVLIASIAIANGESLVTRNAKHFKKIRELEVEKW